MVQILTLLGSKGQYLGLIYFRNLPKNDNVRKCRNNNNSGNPLTSRRTDGGKNQITDDFAKCLETCFWNAFLAWSPQASNEPRRDLKTFENAPQIWLYTCDLYAIDLDSVLLNNVTHFLSTITYVYYNYRWRREHFSRNQRLLFSFFLPFLIYYNIPSNSIWFRFHYL